MKYLKKVIVENFQSHKYTEVEFDSSLNVIVGPSDQGKSAIIRGIKWVLFNEPSGTFFIREGEKECSVTLLFNDKTRIKRLRTPSKNLYILYDEDGKESIYEGFGTSVPEEVIDKTHIVKVYLSNNQTAALNIGDQLEGPFLLSEKSSSRANAIGRLVGVHIVDKAVTETLKDIRNLNVNTKSIEGHLKSLEEQHHKYDYLDNLKTNIEKLEILNKTIQIKSEKKMQIEKLNDKIRVEEKERNEVQTIVKKLNSLSEALLIYKSLEKRTMDLKLLIKKRKNLNSITSDINMNKDALKKLAKVNSYEELIKELSKKIEYKQQLLRLNQRYKGVMVDKKKWEDYSIKLKDTKDAHYLYKTLESKCSQLQKITSLKSTLLDNHKRVLIGDRYIKALQNLDKVAELSTAINNKITRKEKLDNYLIQYSKIGKEISEATNHIKDLGKKINIILNNYGDLLNHMEICPLCMNKINTKHIDDILNKLR